LLFLKGAAAAADGERSQFSLLCVSTRAKRKKKKRG